MKLLLGAILWHSEGGLSKDVLMWCYPLSLVHSASHVLSLVYPCLICLLAGANSGISTICANQCLNLSEPSSLKK